MKAKREVQYSVLDKNTLEVEGIKIKKFANPHGQTYFKCLSKRQVNSPQCDFKGRVFNFDPERGSGIIDILQDHSDGCKFVPGNEAKDYKNLGEQAKKYKEMKDYIRNKLEEENWLTPDNLQLKMKKDPNLSIDKILSTSQISDIVKEWRKETNSSKELYVENNPLNANNLPFLRV